LVERLERPFLWIDAFAYPALFSWHTGKNVSRDVIPKSSEFNAKHYATLVAYPAPFHKNGFAFFYPNCRSYEGEDCILLFVLFGDHHRACCFTPIGFLLVHRVSWKLVWTSFFTREGGEQAEHGDSTSGGHGVGIQLVDVVAENVVEDVAPAQLKCQKKRKTKVVDAGEPSHPVKKLRDDHGALGGPTVGGKSQSSIQRLFAGVVQNVKVRGGVMPTLPFVTSFVSTTPERVNIAEVEVDSVVKTSVPIIPRATTTPTADPAAIAKEKLVGSSDAYTWL
nr:hypothetical protein [Tanacetum cinerariifolium]